MFITKKTYKISYILYILICWQSIWFASCNQKNIKDIQSLNREANIYPDYLNVTIPPNIAPLNFAIKEEAKHFKIVVSSFSNNFKKTINTKSGIVKFPNKFWKKLLEDSKGKKIKIEIYAYGQKNQNLQKFNPIYMHVANERIDPYLSYRLLYPGYQSWSKMKIVQRSLENFKEKVWLENQIIENNCVNCHSFNANSPDRFLVHVRGSKGGTYFIEDKKIKKLALETKYLSGGATYPSWHPSGKYVAFSSNQVKQSFYSHPDKDIEVYDILSTLVLYDIFSNKIYYIEEVANKETYIQTFPSWSPDGKYLYFCEAKKVDENFDVNNINKVHYNLVRKKFYPESKSFGEDEMIFNASELGKSVSFPKISPNGKYLIFTLHDFGTFPIWHKEADLYLLDIQTNDYQKLTLNSSDTESYHGWSSNGKWLVFSSKREDGRSAKPYFAFFDSPDNTGKPFVLPQKNPAIYENMLLTFNLPELINKKIQIKPRKFASASNKKPLQAIEGNPDKAPSKLIFNSFENNSSESKWQNHE